MAGLVLGAARGGQAGAGPGGRPRSAAQRATPPLVPVSLTARQLAGQRVIASYRGGHPPKALLHAIGRGEVAGVILFSENASHLAAVRRLTAQLQAVHRPAGLRQPLLILVDQEGGAIRRFPDAPPAPSARAMGTMSVTAVQRLGRRTGEALRRAGVNVDLAPVADVPSGTSVMDAERRTFGSSLARVTPRAAGFAAGLTSAGVIATAKHFPGFGAATVNTDTGTAVISLPIAALRAGERPFAAVVGAGARLVMISNATYTALDPDHPATLSAVIATRELRDQLQFGGVSISDALMAAALRPFGAAGARAVRAARAGDDLLILGQGFLNARRATNSLAAALRSGRLDPAATRTAVGRILQLRSTLP